MFTKKQKAGYKRTVKKYGVPEFWGFLGTCLHMGYEDFTMKVSETGKRTIPLERIASAKNVTRPYTSFSKNGGWEIEYLDRETHNFLSQQPSVFLSPADPTKTIDQMIAQLHETMIKQGVTPRQNHKIDFWPYFGIYSQ